jgi:hypothetical protein
VASSAGLPGADLAQACVIATCMSWAIVTGRWPTIDEVADDLNEIAFRESVFTKLRAGMLVTEAFTRQELKRLRLCRPPNTLRRYTDGDLAGEGILGRGDQYSDVLRS